MKAWSGLRRQPTNFKGLIRWPVEHTVGDTWARRMDHAAHGVAGFTRIAGALGSAWTHDANPAMDAAPGSALGPGRNGRQAADAA